MIMRALTILTMLLVITTSSLSRVALSANDQQRRRSTLWRGDSISVVGDATMVSPNGHFSCGFHRVATNAYVLAIWFTASADTTLAWAANRDAPVNGIGSRAVLLRDGSFVLQDFDGQAVWSTNTSGTGADRAQLLDTGNLVVSDFAGRTLWESFDWPTDTLLPGQLITRHRRLVSAKSRSSTYSGYYVLYFDSSNVLNVMYDGPEINLNFWPSPFKTWKENGRMAFNSTRHGSLDALGSFSASDNLRFQVSDVGSAGIMRRLTMDYDGNLRAYSLDVAGGGTWRATWAAFLQQCRVHGVCGRYGVCTYGLDRPACACPEGFTPADPGDWSKGCRRLFDLQCGEEVYFAELPKVDYWGFDKDYKANISFEECRQMCLDDCSCEAFGYKKGGKGMCYAKNSLWNGRGSELTQFMYFKVPSRVGKSLNLSSVLSLRFDGHACSKHEQKASVSYYSARYLKNVGGSKINFVYVYSFLGGLFVVEAIVIAAGYLFVFRADRATSRRVHDEGYSLLLSQFRGFTYNELSNATCDFREELWMGASGAVYKGVLDDGRDVAVTRLAEVTPQADQVFRTELNVIGRVNHMNLVRVWGFCSERSHRLIVSEHVENGSLAKALFGVGDGAEDRALEWTSRYKIAVGVAKGLAYLHHECLELILHCDVKPENILLDAALEPKITGFGLVKLLSQDNKTGRAPSMVQVTRGHAAPEWALSLPITGKADVYSFGVVLLELLRGKRVREWAAADSPEGEDVRMDSQGIGAWIEDQMLERHGERLAPEQWLEEFLDARLLGDFNRLQAASMLEVAVACVEDEPSRRPSMEAVVEKLLSSQHVGSTSLRRVCPPTHEMISLNFV